MHEGGKKGVGFWKGKRKEKDNFEDLPINGQWILKWILKKIGLDGTDCINFAQDRDKWQDAVNMVINLLVPQNACSF